MVTFSLKEREKKMNKKSSGQKLSTQASKIMRSNNSSQIQKSLAASVLSQRNTDYMFPKTKEDTVATISEQLGAYREIKERVEDLEKRIEMLDKIQVYDRELTNVRAEKVRTETVLKCIDIEENIIRLKGRESELESVEKEADEAKKEQKILQDELQTIRDERARVQAELNNSNINYDFRIVLRRITDIR